MPALLEAKGLHAGYGETKVLHGLDFAVAEGGVTALLGANGAGKTTTLRAICGMIKTQGEIWFDGARIDGVATESVVRRGVAHVPDGRGTFMELTVEENMRLGAYTRNERDVAGDFERMFGYFPRLRERYHQQAGTLSGGEQQMLAIARALLLRPRLLLLDEPSFGLAPLIVQEIFQIMRRIRAEQRMSILLVEQNASLALDFAEQAYLLETGRIVMSGPAAEIRQDELVRRSYLGYLSADARPDRPLPLCPQPPPTRRMAAAAVAVTSHFSSQHRRPEGTPTWKVCCTSFFPASPAAAIYASVALALVMIYQATHHVNFAQGEMATFSTYIALTLINAGFPYWVAFFITIVVSFIIGVLIERMLMRPMQNAPVLSSVGVFIGLLLIINSLQRLVLRLHHQGLPLAVPRPRNAGRLCVRPRAWLHRA